MAAVGGRGAVLFLLILLIALVLHEVGLEGLVVLRHKLQRLLVHREQNRLRKQQQTINTGLLNITSSYSTQYIMYTYILTYCYEVQP